MILEVPGRLLLALLVIAIPVLAQALLPATTDRVLPSALLDAGHVPLFGLVASAVWVLSTRMVAGAGRTRHYALALLVVIGLGVATELVQTIGERDADPVDFLRNLLGGGAALLVLAAFDRRLLRGGARDRLLRWLLVLGATAALVGALLPLALTLDAMLQRDRSFPVLLDFERRGQERFLAVRKTRMHVRPAPAEWEEAGSSRVGHLTFEPSSYPALILRELAPDWRHYDRLVVELYSPHDRPTELLLRVDDRRHDKSYSDRFNTRLRLEPGPNRIEIPLEEIRTAPRSREMDLARIRSLAIFADQPTREWDYLVGTIRLER